MSGCEQSQQEPLLDHLVGADQAAMRAAGEGQRRYARRYLPTSAATTENGPIAMMRQP
jgi:hypothetical protein